MTMSRNERGLSRRAFLGLGATAAMAAGAAGLAGCSPQASSDAASAGASDAGAAGGPSFLTGPSPIAESDIKETVEADIVIVGAGLSGISAARAAVESGAKNIVVVEKATTWQYRSNQVGCIGGKIQEDLGIHIDKNAAVGQIMKECGYRPNQRILNLWADNSGEAFDWFLAASEGQYVVEAESDTYDGKSMSVRKMHWPHPAEANIADDFYPIFDDCQICLPDNGPYIQNMVDICEKAGVQFLYSTFARQLVRPDNAGRVEGVIVEDENGDYKKITASKAVLLATGDYASNAEMMSYYVPWSDRFMSIFPNVDAKGEKTNTGDGPADGHVDRCEDGGRPARSHDAPPGRTSGHGRVLAGGHQRRALHERGRGRPAVPEPAFAPAEEDGLADLRQQVERPDQVHGHRPRQRELVRGVGRDVPTLVRQNAIHLRRGSTKTATRRAS